jgi:hypothetical protein
MVWQVAHCCLNSIAPSGGFAAGGAICAAAIVAAGPAPQNASPIKCAKRRFVICVTVAVRRC